MAPPIPERPKSDYAIINIATEAAFAELLTQAHHEGLLLEPCMGLMYLPSEAITRQFQEACRALVACLRKNE